jgi:hypothetical protein
MIEKSTIFSFKSVEINDQSIDELLKSLLEEKIHGIVIKNFLSDEEITTLKNKIQSIPIEQKTIINEGFRSYPLSFAQFSQKLEAGLMNVNDYLKIAHFVLSNQAAQLGINITERLIKFLSKSNIIKQVSPIIEKNSQKPLIPFNIRELLPGSGELIIHCENLFFDEFPAFFKWLKLMDITDNKLSYFITVQNAEKGGELCCFDLSWQKVKKRISPTKLLDETGEIIDLEKTTIETFLLKPEEGDLLLFAGGNIWHRVLTVQGNKSRITIGGFIAETNMPGRYYIWS